MALLAWLAASSVTTHVRRLEDARAALGTTTEVWVASSDIGRGETVIANQRAVPIAFVPDAAVVDLGSDAVARHPIAAGELIVSTDVAGRPSQLVPDGWVVVAVIESPSSGAGTGEAVRVASGGVVIADDAVVIEAHPDRTLVAVPAPDGALVATANQSNDIALLRVVGG